MRSRVRFIPSLFVCTVAALGALGCEIQRERPPVVGQCTAEGSGYVPCVCPGGESTGWISCALAGTGMCGGCLPPTNTFPGAGAAGTGAAVGGAASAPSFPGNNPSVAGSAPAPGFPGAPSGVAGSFAPGAAGAGSAPSFPPQNPPGGAAGSSFPAPIGGCAVGEMCKPTAVGAQKFCTANPAATWPPVCPGANQACGTAGNGVCVDGAIMGSPGMFFCVHPTC